METNTVTTREKAEQLLNSLKGEELLAEIDKMLALIDHKTNAYQEAMDKYWKASAQITNLRNVVTTYFKRELDGDKEATVEMDLDDINSLLTDIGADELKFTYSAEVTITFTITGVVADSEDDANTKIMNAISYEISSNLDYDNCEDDNYEVENVKAE